MFALHLSTTRDARSSWLTPSNAITRTADGKLARQLLPRLHCSESKTIVLYEPKLHVRAVVAWPLISGVRGSGTRWAPQWLLGARGRSTRIHDAGCSHAL